MEYKLIGPSHIWQLFYISFSSSLLSLFYRYNFKSFVIIVMFYEPHLYTQKFVKHEKDMGESRKVQVKLKVQVLFFRFSSMTHSTTFL